MLSKYITKLALHWLKKNESTSTCKYNFSWDYQEYYIPSILNYLDRLWAILINLTLQKAPALEVL